MKKKVTIIFLYFFVLLLIFIALFSIRPKSIPTNKIPTPMVSNAPTLIPTPTPFSFESYNLPKTEKKEIYKIAMIGDSMTSSLGPHGGGMSEYMNKLYNSQPGTQRIIIDNYAISSNILALNNQLNRSVTVDIYTFGPLMTQDYDLILVESFGYNPLSEFGLVEGVKKQNEALKKLMEILITSRPKMGIIFVATISPNRTTYATSTQPDSTSEGREKLADERILYIKNHIEYAKSHNIPLINIYEKSLTEIGDGNLKYINKNDDIHPSFLGVEFIGQEIANYILDNEILL